MTCLYSKNSRHIPVMSMHRAEVNNCAVLHGGCGWSVPHRWPHRCYIWGILSKGNMMLHEAMRQEAKCFSPSAQFLWEGRRRWSWKPQKQLMALP